MKKDNNVVYLHTYKLTYMKKNLRLIIAIILSGSCFISFFTQCIGTSKQQSPVVQASIEKNKANTTQTEIKENNNIDEDARTTHPAERVFIDKTTSEDGIVISHYTEDEGYTNIFEYTCPNVNMQQVYNQKVRNIEKLLREKLPENNSHYKIETDSVGTLEVTYTYKTKNHLKIELFYGGGATYVEMIRQGKDVKVVEQYCAD